MKGNTMTAATHTDAELTERLADIEDTLNEGFIEVAQKMGLGEKLERTGARIVVSSVVSEAGVKLDFTLEFTKVDVNKLSPLEEIDVVLMEEYAKIFGEKLLNR